MPYADFIEMNETLVGNTFTSEMGNCMFVSPDPSVRDAKRILVCPSCDQMATTRENIIGMHCGRCIRGDGTLTPMIEFVRR